ncbi:hypothetical protein BV20DRAFT_1054488 [Pilatotrama ljubarskyi]|nr:hypothetical protein BV20DRAFT_1054488 [Pilatotrama ljubarskyi]
MSRPDQHSIDDDVEKGQGSPHLQPGADGSFTAAPPYRSDSQPARKTKRRITLIEASELEYISSAIRDSIVTKDRLPDALGFRASLKAAALASCVNVLFLVVPFAWAAHWLADDWGHEVAFILCFISIIPLQYMFDWCGEHVARRTGPDLGDLIRITFKNCVEATLALILLRNCHLRLLQSTIVGVVVLHLLLIQGVAFCVGGSQTVQQQIDPNQAAVNPALLMAGVLSIVLPTSFFAALDRGNAIEPLPASEHAPFDPLVSDAVRDRMLRMSRGIACMLLLVYVASRVYRHVPWPLPCLKRKKGIKDGSETDSTNPDAAQVGRERPPNAPRRESTRQRKRREEPLPHFGVCAILIVVCVGVMCATAEFLVESIDPVRERTDIQAEWFGLVLLPLVSFLPEALVVVGAFAWTLIEACLNRDAQDGTDDPELMFAHSRPIDLSIQFTLWWMPFVILIGWWTGRPMHLLFDYFEVVLLLSACFVVNHVTADGMTNFAEGVIMMTFYAMIATVAWFYPGQPEAAFMLNCPGSVAEAIADGVENSLAVFPL